MCIRDSDDTISVSLPSFMDDDLGALDVSAYGEPDTILYTFKVWDHRTEGRLHTVSYTHLSMPRDRKEGKTYYLLIRN